MSQSLEQLSEQFDSGELNFESLSDTQRQQVDEWKYLGESLRKLPVSQQGLQPTIGVFAANAARKPINPPNQSVQRLSVLVSTVALCFVALMSSLVISESPDWWVQTKPLAPLDLSERLGEYDLVMMQLPPGDTNSHSTILSSLETEGIVNRSQQQDSNSTATLIEAQISASDLEAILLSDCVPAKTEEESLLGRFVESLQTPSRSELYFNEVVIVLPQEVLDRVHRQNSKEPNSVRPRIYVVTRRFSEDCEPTEFETIPGRSKA